jgi:fructokinase
MKKILCIGEALIDMICTDKGTSLSDGQNFLKKAGGAPTNVAAAIAALGGEVDLSAKVGSDPFGKHLIDTFHEFNINTRYVLQDPHAFTTFAFVSLMPDGERDFYFNRGADGQLTKEEIEEIDLKQFSIVHFGSATAFLPGPLQAAYQTLLQKCLKENIFISFDPNYRQLLFQHDQPSFIEQSWNFINNCQLFKLSDEEAILITGKLTIADAVETLLQKSKSTFAITLGKDGTLLGYNGETVIIPSIPVIPIDTTGAGDAFVGALLYQLAALENQDINSLPIEKWKQLFYNANKAGARTCEYLGAMEAFKHLNREIFND